MDMTLLLIIYLSPLKLYVTEDWRIQIYPFGGYIIQDIPDIDIVRYSTPELLMDEPKPHNGTDVYQWGLIFYEIATHTKPYHDVEDIGIIKQMILSSNYPKPPNNVFLPKYLSNILNKCWMIDCSLRLNTSDFLNQYKESQIFNDNFEETRTFWNKDLWTILSNQKEKIAWDDFFQNFCDFFKIYIDRHSDSYTSLKYAFASNIINSDNFSGTYFWLTDSFTNTWGTVKTIIDNVQLNWFWAKASSQNEEVLLKSRKQFIARFSVRTNAYLVTYRKGSKKKLVHIKVDSPYILKKKVKEFQKRFSLVSIKEEKKLEGDQDDGINQEIKMGYNELPKIARIIS